MRQGGGLWITLSASGSIHLRKREGLSTFRRRKFLAGSVVIGLVSAAMSHYGHHRSILTTAASILAFATLWRFASLTSSSTTAFRPSESARRYFWRAKSLARTDRSRLIGSAPTAETSSFASSKWTSTAKNASVC